MRSQRRRNVARLAQVEPFEGLVDQQRRLGGQQADAQQDALSLAFGERADRVAQQRLEVELSTTSSRSVPAAEKANREIEGPADRLCRPRGDAIGQVEGLGIIEPGSRTLGQDSGEAFEERGLPGTVRTNQTEHFSGPDGEADTVQREKAPVRLRHVGHTQSFAERHWAHTEGAAVVLPAPVGPRAIFGIEACAQRG